MSTRWIPLLLLAVLWSASSVAHGDEFRGQGCHIAFPGKHVTGQERTPPPIGWVITELQEDDKGTYALSAFNLPVQELSPDALEAVMKKSREAAVARRGYTLLSDKRLKLDDKYPGLDLKLEKKQAEGDTLMVRMRIYFVGTRVYQVMVSGEKDWTEAEEATKFLDSFGING